MRRSALRVLALVIVAAGSRRNLDDRESLFLLLVAPDGYRELLAADELLDEDLVVVGEGFLECVGERPLRLDDVDADARALRSGLDDDRQREALLDLGGEIALHLIAVVCVRARRRDTFGDEDALRSYLVHRDSSSEDARARVRDAEHVERALQDAVLAELAMQRIEYDRAAALLDILGKRRRIELHALCIVALRLQCLEDGRPRLARDLCLRRRTTHDDDDLILIHDENFSFILFILSLTSYL